MRIIADTNVLLRALLMDDVEQGRAAADLLKSATQIAVTLQTLCEFAWVLKSGYRRKPTEVADSLRRLVASDNVLTDRSAVELGLVVLDLGGDFADGVIAFEGRRLGGSHFATFDRDAARILATKGLQILLLDPDG